MKNFYKKYENIFSSPEFLALSDYDQEAIKDLLIFRERVKANKKNLKKMNKKPKTR